MDSLKRKKLLWYLFPTYLLLIVITLSLATYHATSSLRDVYYADLEKKLEITARLIEQETFVGIEPITNLKTKLNDFAGITSLRITVISPDGKVIGDTASSPEMMDNHLVREEIREALNGRTGRSIRYSMTTKQTMMYVAVPRVIGNEVIGIVRTAIPVSKVEKELKRIYLSVALGGIALILFAGISSVFIIRLTTKPLDDIYLGAERFANGELTKRIQIPKIEELAVLASSLNKMAENLNGRIVTMERQRRQIDAIFTCMTESVFAVDTSERIIEINKTACELFGATIDNAKGRTLQEVIRNTDIQHFVNMAIKSNGSVNGEVVLIGAVERFFDIYGTILKDSQDECIGALFVMHEISDIKRLEIIRKDFVANVSHELRTPITAIKGFVETLEDGAIEDKKTATEFLAIIHRQSDRMLSIIEDLLDLARIEQTTEKETAVMREVNLKDLLDSVVETCKLKATEHRIELKLQTDCELKLVVERYLIELAIANLVDNAIKYSDEGGAVLLSAKKDNEFVLISVTDNGIGIPREYLERIFERFYRVDKSRSRERGGTGLGLSIVKHIALLHKGRVTVVSAPGQGSTFTIALPVIEPGNV
jgi:two-component system, OmpR family, phosphate regulon sensor histidine kinase PhoR